MLVDTARPRLPNSRHLATRLPPHGLSLWRETPPAEGGLDTNATLNCDLSPRHTPRFRATPFRFSKRERAHATAKGRSRIPGTLGRQKSAGPRYASASFAAAASCRHGTAPPRRPSPLSRGVGKLPPQPPSPHPAVRQGTAIRSSTRTSTVRRTQR